MKNINIKILALIALLATYSCSDDFIDVKSPDPNTEDFFNNEAEYQKALVAAYDMLQATAKIYQLGEIASDNTLCGGQDALDTPGFQEIDDMIHTPVNAQLRDIWTWMYTGVNRTNYIMEFKDKIDFPNKTSVIAQTRFLRAYYYFQLVKWFGPVPMAIDTRIQFGDQFDIDRTPVDQVYAQIEADLEFAAANLPLTVNETGRITKGAAQALLGKVYLFDKKYPESAAALKSVIDSNVYRLLTTEAPLMWENDHENGPESVFEIQYSDLEGGSYDCFYCLEGNYAIGFNGPRGYTGPVFDFGYSFNVPTQESYDAYEDGDIRRDYSILNMSQWLADNPDASYDESAGYEQTGYFNRKYIARKGDLNLPDAALTNPNNTRAIRYADVLLMYAEATAMANGGAPTSDSYEYLNKVHRRAFGLPVDSPDPSDYSGLSASAFADVILKERRLELMGEGHRFFDLVRMGKAAEYIPGFQAPKNNLFPIPIQEIQLSGDRWAQNPGY